MFIETWLAEMPASVPPIGNLYPVLASGIKGWIDNGISPVHLGDNLYSIGGQTIKYYWLQSGNDISVAVELQRLPAGYSVNMVGKNPNISTATPPFATDLYAAVLDNITKPMIFSDEQVTTDGFAIWRRLLSVPGLNVSVYDTMEPGRSFATITTEQELQLYIGDDKRNFRFTLSKKGSPLAEMNSYFNLRRFRELSGQNLTDFKG
jgi:hypothetical protein